MQYSDDDLEAAVGAGVLTPEAAEGLRGFVERRRAIPAADEESFRLLTGFNDIFVAIAVLMVLIALSWLGARAHEAVGSGLVAATSWGLAEFFTRRRRMALPSILLLLAFVLGVGFTAQFLSPFVKAETPTAHILWVGGLGAAAAFAHWRRFRVPITVAAGMLTIGATGVILFAALVKEARPIDYAILIAGLVAFALALAWDMSDPSRKTRRADVAFWLHLLAAPAIVHPAFALFGIAKLPFDLSFPGPDDPTPAVASPDASVLLHAALAIGVYALLAFVALVVDRRALMVSGLLYLLYAANSALQATGALTLSFALSALIVGAALLMLSAFWAPTRRAALRLVPTAARRFLPPAA